MKTITIVLISMCIALAVANPVKKNRLARRIVPEEYDINRRKSFLWEDEAGKLHVEHLEGVPESRKASVNDITLYLYTKNNQGDDGIDPEQIYPNNFETMKQSKYFKSGRKSIFLVHGWNNYMHSPVNRVITAALLSKYDVNVFVVDWSIPANKNYLSAKAAVPIIGAALGDFIDEMMEHYSISNKYISLMGHSLGAHVAGCAGAQMAVKPNYIIGLDPASPLFSLGKIDNRLDETDADFVQVIHTCGGLLGLGFSSAIGHADYYPNGGSSQPGCGLDIAGTCAHARAYYYLAESIKFSGGFEGHLCENYKYYGNGECFDNHQSDMGTFGIDKSADGDYYLATNGKAPYAKESFKRS